MLKWKAMFKRLSQNSWHAGYYEARGITWDDTSVNSVQPISFRREMYVQCTRLPFDEGHTFTGHVLRGRWPQKLYSYSAPDSRESSWRLVINSQSHTRPHLEMLKLQFESNIFLRDSFSKYNTPTALVLIGAVFKVNTGSLTSMKHDHPTLKHYFPFIQSVFLRLPSKMTHCYINISIIPKSKYTIDLFWGQTLSVRSQLPVWLYFYLAPEEERSWASWQLPLCGCTQVIVTVAAE